MLNKQGGSLKLTSNFNANNRFFISLILSIFESPNLPCMKKLPVILFVLLNIQLCFGKIFESDSSAKSKTYSKYELFVNFGSSMPVGAFGQTYKSNDANDIATFFTQPIEGKVGGFGAEGGFTGEIGGIFYFNDKPKKTTVGLRAIFFSFASFPFKWESDSDYVFNYAAFKPLNLVSFRAGPSVHIIGKKMTLDVFYQIGPAFASHARWSTYEDDDHKNDKSHLDLHNGFGLRHELGLSIGYKWIKLGCSYNLIKIKYNGVEFYRGISGYGNITEHFSAKAPTSFLNVFIGLRIGK